MLADADALIDYFATTTATQHHQALTAVATPQIHLIRGLNIPSSARNAVDSIGVPFALGEHIYGFVEHDHQQPNPDTAVQVTAKWTNKTAGHLEELKDIDQIAAPRTRSSVGLWPGPFAPTPSSCTCPLRIPVKEATTPKPEGITVTGLSPETGGSLLAARRRNRSLR